jgi:hypothetical protein
MAARGAIMGTIGALYPHPESTVEWVKFALTFALVIAYAIVFAIEESKSKGGKAS